MEKSEKIEKRKNKGKIIFLCFGKFSLVFFFILILCLYPLAKGLYDSQGDILSQRFFGKKSEYQGILRLWNVDSFEGGSLPKTNFLEKMSMQFEKQNKGVYIMVQNLTEDEVVANIKNGIYPDIVSFGTGMNKFFSGKLMSIDDSVAINILPNFYGAGLSEGSLKAVSYMAGAYSLISTSEKIEKTGKDKTLKLSSLAFALDQNIQKKKAVRHINSLTFGVNDYTSAFDIFARKFKDANAVNLAEAGVLDKNYNKQNAYAAYESFVKGDSNMLLGTQRDVYRMENRLMAGKEIDVLYEPLSEWTDLVQYLGILQKEKTKYNLCVDFIKFVLSENSQKQLCHIGMMSVRGLKLYENEPFCSLEKVINDKIIVKSVF